MTDEPRVPDPSAGDGSDWRAAVEVREDRELAEELRRRLPPEGAPPALSVTDLLAPRRAYWEAVAPVPVAPERVARMLLGRTLHRRLGFALDAAGPREVRLRRDGIAGRVDVLADVPVELKTGTVVVPPADLIGARPDQVEQLAIYASLLDRPAGRLIAAVVEGKAVAGIQAVDLELRDLAAIRSEAGRRRDRLRAAWTARSPDGLPRCPWFGRGCDFLEANVCGCTGTEPTEPSVILAEVNRVRDRPEVAEEIAARLERVPVVPPRVGRFRDLLYLRRTYFDRTMGSPPEERPPRDPNAPADLYERIRAGVESGPVGEVASLPPRSDEIEEEVAGFRGAPWIERVTRAWERPNPGTILERFPQYVLELGLRCVAVGAPSGRVFLGWDRASLGSERVLVFEVRLTSPTRFARLWRDRLHRLEGALAASAPRSLDPCPGWMPATCPYSAECGCADDAGRSQR